MAHVTTTTEEIVPDNGNVAVSQGGNYIARVVYSVASIIEGLLVVRLVLALLGANGNNIFASFINGVTYPFVQPFVGLFAIVPQVGVSRFEVETMAAIVVVALIAWILSTLFGMGSRRAE